MRGLLRGARLLCAGLLLLACWGQVGCAGPETILLGIEGPIGGRLSLVISGDISRLEGLEGQFATGKIAHYTLTSNAVRIEGTIRSFVLLASPSGGKTPRIRSIDITRAPSLATLMCEQQLVDTINLSRNGQLVALALSGNPLRSLDVSKCPLLERLSLDRTHVASLDLSRNPKLEKLSVEGARLHTLSLKGCLQLATLQCDSNRVQSLDLSDLHALRILSCSENLLDTLMLEKNRQLELVDCSGNALRALDLSSTPKLRELRCHGNRIGEASMERLVSSLPMAADRTGRFVPMRLGCQAEGNVSTAILEALARLKGWQVYEMASRGC